jgi:hypothetical protein
MDGGGRMSYILHFVTIEEERPLQVLIKKQLGKRRGSKTGNGRLY